MFVSIIDIVKLSMQDELKYRMTSDDRCREYFYIDVDSGDISLKKLLEDETITRFEVFGPYCLALRLYMHCVLCSNALLLIRQNFILKYQTDN